MSPTTPHPRPALPVPILQFSLDFFNSYETKQEKSIWQQKNLIGDETL